MVHHIIPYNEALFNLAYSPFCRLTSFRLLSGTAPLNISATPRVSTMSYLWTSILCIANPCLLSSVEKSTLEEIKEAVGSLDNATSLASKGKAAEEWLKAQDGAAEAAAGVAVGNMLTLLFDASNTDADGDGIPDADERDKNEDNIPDELHKGLRKAISSSVRFGEAPEGIVEGFKEFGEELLSKIKIPSVPLPRLSHFMEDLNKALADAQEELEPGLLMAYGTCAWLWLAVSGRGCGFMCLHLWWCVLVCLYAQVCLCVSVSVSLSMPVRWPAARECVQATTSHHPPPHHGLAFLKTCACNALETVNSLTRCNAAIR